MRLRNLEFLIAAIALSCAAVFAAGPGFYFAADGSDASDCASPATACKSLERLNVLPQLPGTSFLLRRGDRFLGSILAQGSGTVESPIVFSAYGQGPAPVIDGGVPAAGWALASQGPDAWIWSADVPTDVDGEPFALIDGIRPLPLARFPDTGYVKVIAADSTSLVLDGAAFAGHLDAIAGATLHARAPRRPLASRVIKSFNPATGRLTWAEPMDKPLPPGSGVFISEAAQELDHPGEWYCAPASARPPADGRRLRLALAPGDSPAAHALRIANAGYGIKGSGLSHVRIAGIDFENQVSAGIYLYDCAQIEIIGCGIRNAILTGLEFRGSGLTATGNSISGSLLAGISAGPDPKLNVLETQRTDACLAGNRIARIGLTAGFGRGAGDETEMGLGLSVIGDGNVVEGNRIDSTGADGIRFLGKGNRIEGNALRWTGMRFDETGAVHAGPLQGPWGTEGSLIKRNLVIHAPGPLAYGIFLDDRSAGVTVEGDFAFDAETGVFLRGRGHILKGNLLYGNRQAPLRETRNEGTAYVENALWALWPRGTGFLPALPAQAPCGPDSGACGPTPTGNLACVETGGSAACDGDFAARYPAVPPASLAERLREFTAKASAPAIDLSGLMAGLDALLPAPSKSAPK